MRCHIQQDVQPFLDTHGSHVADQEPFAVSESGDGRNRFERFQVRSIADNEHIFGGEPSTSDRQLLITGIRCYDHVGKTIRESFQPNLCPVKEVFALVFRKVQLRVGIVVIENVFHAKKFERQCNQKNIIGGVASLDHVESVTKENPPRVKKLPE